ncbi:MAG: DNA mismatch endonuclease Vsr [Bacteroidales bacterium]|nr:DNA mismatch endonuclease Vsr [Bacteroidales bacterium]
MDVFSKEKRSRIMAQVKGKNTRPEMVVRSTLHKMGYRFRLYRKDLPGKPDITLPKHNKVIFVHGCFWHGHEGCPRSKRPATNIKFWNEKLDKNIKRDKNNIKALRKLGWKPLIIWTCEIKDTTVLKKKFEKFLKQK